MTNREQAIRDVAEACSYGEDYIRLSFPCLDVADRRITYAVEQRERVLELEAERAEQLSVLNSVGPITCRNGKQHEHYDGCVYCRIEELEAFLEKVISVNAASTEPDVGELSYALGGIAYEAMKLQPKGE